MITPLFTFDEKLLNGSDYTQASWSKTNLTLTANSTAAPDGSVTAMKVLVTASAAASLSQTVNSAGKASGKKFFIYAKQGSAAVDGNSFQFRNGTTSTTLLACTVNYGTGVVTYTVGGPTGISMIALSGSWWLIIFDSTGLALSDGDQIICSIGYVGNAETASEFVYLWGGSLRSFLQPTYPAYQKPLADQKTSVRHDSITSSGIRQAIVERKEIFKPLNFAFVPQVDMPMWQTFTDWALDGQVFTYYADSTVFTAHTDYSLEDTTWTPKKAAFGHATFSINMRQWV